MIFYLAWSEADSQKKTLHGTSTNTSLYPTFVQPDYG